MRYDDFVKHYIDSNSLWLGRCGYAVHIDRFHMGVKYYEYNPCITYVWLISWTSRLTHHD